MRLNAINVFLGNRLPIFFQQYLTSIEKNSDILNVYFFTNLDLSSYILPTNFHLFNITKNFYRDKCSTFLNQIFNLNVDPNILFKKETGEDYFYKICDWRPFNYFLFEDILNIPHDQYIGWSDCDIVYGKLSNFINIDYVKENTKSITIGGPLSFLKIKEFGSTTKMFCENFNTYLRALKTQNNNLLYLETIKDWNIETFLTTQKSTNLDEALFTSRFLEREHKTTNYSLWKYYANNICNKELQLKSGEFNKKFILDECDYKAIHTQYNLIVNINNKAYEVALLHLMKCSDIINSINNNNNNNNNNFFINRKGFYLNI